MSVIHTRFAPSPTGRLHLGHAWSAVQAHDFARAAGGRFSLRIEDIDGTRSRPEHVAAILADLEWLGLGWDGEVTFQSRRLHLYEAALDRLRAMDLLYPCFCTRADIAASASAPHGPEGAVYLGTCRGLAEPDLGRPHAWRLDMERAISLLPGTGRGRCSFGSPPASQDRVRGTRSRCNAREARGGGGSPHGTTLADSPRHQPAAGLPPRAAEELWWHDHGHPILANPAAQGDIVLARKDAPASYHLAVTVDDAAQGITHIVRGNDLFEATHIHRLLQALLGLPTPEYRHHPLLAAADGTRLAKRHGAPSLEAMRQAGEDGRALANALRGGALPVGIALAKD